MKKTMQRLKFYHSIQLFRFFYLNYFCRNVVRESSGKIIPYKHAVLEFGQNSKIVLQNGDIEIGCDQIRGAKTETRVRLRERAVWNARSGCQLSYGGTIEVLADATLNSGYFTMNSNSVVIAAKQINLGQDVMIARNVVIYDSDYHQLLDENGTIRNRAGSVSIGDHVWIGTNVFVSKGSCIGSESVIGANSVVHGEVPAGTIYSTEQIVRMRSIGGRWDRMSPQ